MRRVFSISALWLLSCPVIGQNLPGAMKLPDFVQPTPEVSSILKADNLSVSNATGSPNISIPIGTLAVNGIKLPITIGYNSTGIKVDEYSSMIGTGWNCSPGGVVSRTIFHKPDESRSGSSYPTNLSNPNFNSLDANLLNFLKNTPDAESDIFSFSFLNYSGKFILDSNLTTIIPLSNYNLKIKVISNNFLNGFEITTEDGTVLKFDETETSKSRNPLGTSCPKSYEYSNNITSWYLTRITAPNKRSYMNFTYLTQNILFEQSINQFVSKCISTEYHMYGGGDEWNTCPTGAAQSVGSETFYTCVTRQLVTSKFLSKIITSANDTASFIYDASMRQDLDSGKRLSQIKIISRNGTPIRQATLYASYSNGTGTSTYTNSNKRMYLDSLLMDDITSSANSLSYKFEYNSRGSVANRLTFGQDIYGYSNGHGSNPSLIPVLPSTDQNYSHFNNGTGATSVTFGDRSIDTNYAKKGLLNKIIYPTGGYDTIIYYANKYYNSTTHVLAGGSSVASIQSYSFGSKAMERSFSYTDTSGNSSTFMLSTLARCSKQDLVYTSGYICNGGQCLGCFPVSVTIGPSYWSASVSSNLINPITALGSQHAYHRNVKESTVGTVNNGYTEHHYQFFNGGNLLPYDLLNNPVLSAPMQVVNDIVIGEDLTRVYRYDTATSSYKLQKSTTNYLFMHHFDDYYNYVIQDNNFMPLYTNTPPASYEFLRFDATKYAINKFVVYSDSTIEVTYDNNNDSFIVKTVTEHSNSLHTYPTKQKVYTPDGDTLETRMSYPLDGSASVLTARNIVAPVLEEKKYKNSSLLSTVTNTYYNWLSDSSIVALQKTQYKELTNSLPVHINYIGYDSLGNVLEIAKDSGVHKSYLWGHNKQLPIAVASNAASNEIFYTSFEETDGTADSDAKTGGKSRTSNYTVSFSLPNSKNYILSYWSWDGSKWVYNEAAYTGSTTITVANKIDEVRVYPAAAQMVTFTYTPLLGMTSQCDARNQVSYYEYDALNRLKLIRDENRKIVKLFDYKYQQ